VPPANSTRRCNASRSTSRTSRARSPTWRTCFARWITRRYGAGVRLHAVDATRISVAQVRSECDAAQQEKIDELWKIIKMMYGGASRTEAIIARRELPVPDTAVADAYQLCLRFLNPATSAAAGCSFLALKRALELLDCSVRRQNQHSTLPNA